MKRLIRRADHLKRDGVVPILSQNFNIVRFWFNLATRT
jgi:hypothetical protein